MTDEHVATTVQRLRDEQAVRDLGYRFADVCNRRDVEAFRALWTDDGTWIIDYPVNVRAEGGDDIAVALGRMPEWDFFVQMPHAPVVHVDGDRASSTWTVSEHANNAAEGRGYFNYARYDDELARTPEGWRYVRRHYSYYHIDQTPLPQMPTGSDRPEASTRGERPTWAPRGVDLSVPSVARIYDYYLGGTHNVEVDREAARHAIAAWPGLPKIMQANRGFMRRAVRFASDEGIRQFLDIGSGIPTSGNLHEVAQSRDPEANVVYVDNDAVAVAHSRAVLEGNERAGVVSADFRSPRDILRSAEVERLLDFEKPVALSLIAVLHFVEDVDDPWRTLRELGEALAPGSLLILLHSSTDEGPERDGGIGVRDVYSRAGSPLVQRTRSEIERFFDGLELVEPGVVAPHHWRPGSEPVAEDPILMSGFAGVGRKAGNRG